MTELQLARTASGGRAPASWKTQQSAPIILRFAESLAARGLS